MLKKVLLLFLLLPVVASAQLKISGTFNPEEGYTFGILYRIATDNVFYETDAAIATDGSFSLTLQQPLAPGMYRMVYNLPQDQYFFDFLYNGKEDLNFKFSNKEGAVFQNSTENQLWTSYRSKKQQFDTDIFALIANEETSKKDIKKLLKAQKEWYEETFEASSGMLVRQFVEFSKPYLTEEYSTPEDYFGKAKKAYFANSDFSNPVLQQSAFPLEYALMYLYNFKDKDDYIPSLKQNTDNVVKALANATPAYKKTLLTNIWDFMVGSELTEVANHLGEKHLIPLASQLNDTKLSERVTVYKNTSIGNKASDFSWKNEDDDETKSFYNIANTKPAKRYVLVFWSVYCSHCLAEIPELHAYVKNLEQGAATVIAVGLEEEPYEWKNKTYDLPLFEHVLGMGKWENNIGNMYDVSATPTYFVLDKDFKIIAKPETLEEVKDLIEVKM